MTDDLTSYRLNVLNELGEQCDIFIARYESDFNKKPIRIFVNRRDWRTLISGHLPLSHGFTRQDGAVHYRLIPIICKIKVP